jgi:CRISPR-associated protein Cas1
MVGFSGTGGSPLTAAVDHVFLSPQSEYRPTEYMHAWMKMWLDESKRLQIAKRFLKKRLDTTEEKWAAESELGERGIYIGEAVEKFERAIKGAKTTQDLLSAEGVWARKLYANLAKGFGYEDFKRVAGGKESKTKKDLVNSRLDHGNYIAYGFAAVALHALGIAFSLPVLHGTTRRGALVFDVADLFKDWAVMPHAFSSVEQNDNDAKYRTDLVKRLQKEEIIEFCIDILKIA